MGRGIVIAYSFDPRTGKPNGIDYGDGKLRKEIRRNKRSPIVGSERARQRRRNAKE